MHAVGNISTWREDLFTSMVYFSEPVSPARSAVLFRLSHWCEVGSLKAWSPVNALCTVRDRWYAIHAHQFLLRSVSQNINASPVDVVYTVSHAFQCLSIQTKFSSGFVWTLETFQTLPKHCQLEKRFCTTVNILPKPRVWMESDVRSEFLRFSQCCSLYQVLEE